MPILNELKRLQTKKLQQFVRLANAAKRRHRFMTLEQQLAASVAKDILIQRRKRR